MSDILYGIKQIAHLKFRKRLVIRDVVHSPLPSRNKNLQKLKNKIFCFSSSKEELLRRKKKGKFFCSSAKSLCNNSLQVVNGSYTHLTKLFSPPAQTIIQLDSECLMKKKTAAMQNPSKLQPTYVVNWLFKVWFMS